MIGFWSSRSSTGSDSPTAGTGRSGELVSAVPAQRRPSRSYSFGQQPIRVVASVTLLTAAMMLTCGVATTFPGDVAALEAVARSNPWFNATGSWVGGDPCSYKWRGVTCSSSRVTALALRRKNLSGVIPPELGNLASLTALDLSHNSLSGAIPPEIGNLTNLMSLTLSSNYLSGAIPPQLGNLANLTRLSLNDNNLADGMPGELGNMASLTDLDLSINSLSGPIPPELGSLGNLRNLNLSYNHLSGTIPPELGNLTNLTSLSLQGHSLSGTIPPQLGNLVSMTALDLSLNNLSGAIPQELGNMASLKYLHLPYNHLSGTIPPELGNLANLIQLFLHSNKLSGAIPPELGNLTKLSALWLGSNVLFGVIPPELGNLTLLSVLSLGSNVLSGVIPPELGKLSMLVSLDLSDNQRLSGRIPKELGQLHSAVIDLGCFVLSTADSFVCTEWTGTGNAPLFYDSCDICYVPSPTGTILVVWIACSSIGSLVLLLTYVISRYYGSALADSGNKAGIGPIGIGRYLWGLLSLAFITFDVVTNFQVLSALVGSWSFLVVVLLMVLQHVVSGVMLYVHSMRRQAWPFASSLRGLCVKWKWDWRRCIIGSKGEQLLAGDGNGIQASPDWNILLWPLGLVYVVVLDILSLLALKVGFQCQVGFEWVNLQPYWASRELTDALFQALPQAIFQSILLLAHADPKSSKIFITRKQYVVSVSSSLGSVIAVLAMVLWEARAEGKSMLQKLQHQFFGILPLVMDD